MFVVGAATLALISMGALIRPKTRALATELWRLYGSEFLIVGAIVAPALVGGYLYLGVLLLFAVRVQFEFYVLQGLRPWALPRIAGFMAGCILVVASYFLKVTGPYAVLWLICMSALAMWLALSPVVLVKSGTLATFVPILFPVSLIAALGQIHQYPEGFALLLFVYIVVETNDAFASLFGKLLGRIRPFPELSPRKTLEGLVLGATSALMVGITLNHALYHFPLPSTVGAILLILAGAITGDLLFSRLKRNRNLKDFPPIMARHGGLLDIYDSLLVAAPIFFILGFPLLK